MTYTDMPDNHDGCALCAYCGRHLTPEDQWPCLDCGLMLCGSCECPTDHLMTPDQPIYGMCLACRSIEVELVNGQTGTRDFSNIGEHPQYPVGYGCEVCS